MGNTFGKKVQKSDVRRYRDPLPRIPLTLEDNHHKQKSFFSDSFSFEIDEDLSGVETLEHYGILPVGNLLNVFSFLPLDGILECSCSCKLFHRIIDSQVFWRMFYSNISGNFKEKERKGTKNWKKEVFEEFYSFRARSDYYKNIFFSCPEKLIGENSSTNENEQYEFLIFKFLFIGDSRVGKSSLLLRFSDNIFYDHHLSTIGADFKIRQVMYNTVKMKLQVWDIAGEERYHTVTSSYYRGLMGILLCFSIDNLISFKNCEQRWIEEIKTYASEDCQLILVGCRCDLSKERKVTKEMISEFLSKYNLSYEYDYCECSSKDNLYIHLPFGVLLEKAIRRYSEGGYCDLYEKPKSENKNVL